MTDDIYTKLLKEGFLNREVDLGYRKEIRDKQKNKIKVIKKILYDDVSSDSEDDTLTTNQIENNLYIDGNNIKTFINDNYINSLAKKYEIELNDYYYINCKNAEKMKLGGYIRYVNINEELKWGGILVKIINKKRFTRMKLVLKNMDGKYWEVKFKNNYFFYKNNVTKYDKFKELFISKAHLEY